MPLVCTILTFLRYAEAADDRMCDRTPDLHCLNTLKRYLKRAIMLGYGDIISNMRRLGERTEEKYDVVAVGGTSLVLHNIKNATYDVDFIVEDGDVLQFEMDCKECCGGMIDV